MTAREPKEQAGSHDNATLPPGGFCFAPGGGVVVSGLAAWFLGLRVIMAVSGR